MRRHWPRDGGPAVIDDAARWCCQCGRNDLHPKIKGVDWSAGGGGPGRHPEDMAADRTNHYYRRCAVCVTRSGGPYPFGEGPAVTALF